MNGGRWRVLILSARWTTGLQCLFVCPVCLLCDKLQFPQNLSLSLSQQLEDNIIICQCTYLLSVLAAHWLQDCQHSVSGEPHSTTHRESPLYLLPYVCCILVRFWKLKQGSKHHDWSVVHCISECSCASVCPNSDLLPDTCDSHSRMRHERDKAA